jgi:hypothetical protein
MNAGKRENVDFMTEAEIQSFFGGIKNSSIKRWFKAQPLKASRQGQPNYNRYDKLLNGYDYDTITDEWFKWYINGNRQNNVSRFGNPPFIYFVEALPFQRPYFGRITMKQEASLLVPIYSFSASSEEYPSLNSNDLIKLIKKDLSGIKWNTVKATIDGEVINGYCVIRDKSIRIDTIDLYHGGFWLLIRKEVLSPGDHLLSFSADSKTFEVDAKILINTEY